MSKLRVGQSSLCTPFNPKRMGKKGLQRYIVLIGDIGGSCGDLLACYDVRSPRTPVATTITQTGKVPYEVICNKAAQRDITTLPVPQLTVGCKTSVILTTHSNHRDVLRTHTGRLTTRRGDFVVRCNVGVVKCNSALLATITTRARGLPSSVRGLIVAYNDNVATANIVVKLRECKGQIGEVRLMTATPSQHKFVRRALGGCNTSQRFRCRSLFRDPKFICRGSTTTA